MFVVGFLLPSPFLSFTFLFSFPWSTIHDPPWRATAPAAPWSTIDDGRRRTSTALTQPWHPRPPRLSRALRLLRSRRTTVWPNSTGSRRRSTTGPDASTATDATTAALDHGDLRLQRRPRCRTRPRRTGWLCSTTASTAVASATATAITACHGTA